MDKRLKDMLGDFALSIAALQHQNDVLTQENQKLKDEIKRLHTPETPSLSIGELYGDR